MDYIFTEHNINNCQKFYNRFFNFRIVVHYIRRNDHNILYIIIIT